ncbi:hypothetical protein BpHYR1_000461 [Brachionus plicatilis]|uniref:Uncharacterized protein n=1 Tax=Brachionus plicatilis TaxID=10195 RepID=A0A3M7RN36_BRAPC|nr:hypothetical protein BpHYR1_000461 [Brachionus plicatilis]
MVGISPSLTRENTFSSNASLTLGSCHDSLKGFVWCHLYTIASSSKELFCVLIGSNKGFPPCCSSSELLYKLRTV